RQAGYLTLPLHFVLMKNLYPKQLEIAQAVAAMLSEVGIKVNIRNLEIATAREQRTAGNYDLFFSGWAHMPHDPDWYFGQWFTRAGSEKLTRYNNPRVEQLIAEGRVPDPKVRQAKYEELERILWDEEPEIWPYYSVAIYGVSDRPVRAGRHVPHGGGRRLARHRGRGAAGHALRRREHALRGARPVAAELLARHHADPALRGRPPLAAHLRLRELAAPHPARG